MYNVTFPSQLYKLKPKIYTNYAFRVGSIFQCRQAKIANFHASSRTRNKNVITFQITMNNRRISGMQKSQTLQNLSAPRPKHLDVDALKPLQIGFQRAGSHQLGDQNNTPKTYNWQTPVVRMFETKRTFVYPSSRFVQNNHRSVQCSDEPGP